MLWGQLERLTGIEPAYQAWEASALPLSYSRSGTGLNSSRESRSTRITLPQSEFKVVHPALAWPVPRQGCAIVTGWRACGVPRSEDR